jgi:hypothetical protein
MLARANRPPTSSNMLATVGDDVGRGATPTRLRPRREKVFGPPPERHLDGNAKARIWAAAAAYNAAQRRPGQHQGPLTWATLRVLRVLLFRFHGADGGGRCFPAYDKLASAARCARSSVTVALHALEETGLLTWVHRLARQRRQERDLFGKLVSVWQVIRISNGYSFSDPLGREPGRIAYKTENPARPTEPIKNQEDGSGARLLRAPVCPVGETADTLLMRHGWYHGSRKG